MNSDLKNPLLSDYEVRLRGIRDRHLAEEETRRQEHQAKMDQILEDTQTRLDAAWRKYEADLKEIERKYPHAYGYTALLSCLVTVLIMLTLRWVFS